MCQEDYAGVQAVLPGRRSCLPVPSHPGNNAPVTHPAHTEGRFSADRPRCEMSTLPGKPDVPPSTEASAPVAAPSPEGPAPDRPPPDKPGPDGPIVDVRKLQHPYEFSRLLLALSSTVIVFGAIVLWIFIVLPELAVPYLAWVVVVVLVVAVAIWFLVLVHRARLLGSAVLVAPETLPGLAEIIEDVRTSLDYWRRVDVYVAEKASSPVSTWNYLGTRIILLEGGLVADLQEDAKRPQLVFLLGSEFGRLKARQRQFTLVVAWIEGQENLKLLHLFLTPYFRATTYSGDQIGTACCDDIPAAGAMMNRLLVGKDLSPSLAISGVLDQAARVRSRRLPRFAQLAMNEPHLTNRYLNLMAFAERTSPAAAQVRMSIRVEPTTAANSSLIGTHLRERVEMLFGRMPGPSHSVLKSTARPREPDSETTGRNAGPSQQ